MRPNLFIAFLIFATATLALYFPVWRGGFIMDDVGYILKNPWITATDSPLHFWITFDQVDFWPLSYTYYWLAYRAFGENPFPYHLVNFVLHALNVTLVLSLARHLRFGRASWLAALVFLVHPLHVQAVAWIIQFKTLLSTTLALTCALCFMRFLDQKKALWWALSFGAYFLSLLAKTSTVTFPLALLLLPGTSRRAVFPFLAAGALAGVLTVYVNFQHPDAPVLDVAWFDRLPLAARNLFVYLRLFAVPFPLAITYPYQLPGAYGWIFVVLVCGAGFIFRRRPGPAAVLIAAYTLLLLPALGFADIPAMKLSLIADHWTYLPDVCLALLVSASLSPRLLTLRGRVVVSAVLLLLSTGTYLHSRTFAAAEAFWRNARQVNPNSAVPTYNLGVELEGGRRFEEAMREYLRTVELSPVHGRAWFNLGRLYFMNGDLVRARGCFEKSLEHKSDENGYLALAKVQVAQGDNSAAIQTLNDAVKIFPRNLEFAAWLSSLRNSVTR